MLRLVGSGSKKSLSHLDATQTIQVHLISVFQCTITIPLLPGLGIK